MPRSGSMWTFNVARAALRAAGRQVLPDQVPKDDHDMFACAGQAIADRDPNRTWVLKVHSYLRPDVPLSKFINTQRDLRDALVSYMRFMQCDFDQALQAMVGAATITDHYREFKPDSILHLKYVDIMSRPLDVVRHIAEFCSIKLTEAEIADIADRFEKTNVQRLIRDKEADIERRASAGEPIAITEIVRQRFKPNMVRAFDTNTGFQSGHISEYRDGSWRELLTPEQQERMYAVLGDWLQPNEYGID